MYKRYLSLSRTRKWVTHVFFLAGLPVLLGSTGRLGGVALAADEAAKKASDSGYSLGELIRLAEQFNPGLEAAHQATEVIAARRLEAQRSWWPSGEFLTMLAPVPRVKCSPPTGLVKPDAMSDRDFREKNCISTDIDQVNVGFQGVFTRTQLRITQPLYTFGKISTGIEAADAGIAAAQSNEKIKVEQLALNVARAYYLLKMSREIHETLLEGMGYLAEAEKRVQKALDEGSGDMTVTDKLRLATVGAELESRVLEAEKGVQIAGQALRALIGPRGPKKIDANKTPLTAVMMPTRSQEEAEAQARRNRPEVRALDFLVRSQEKLAELEWRMQLPDLVLLGSFNLGYANTIDDPQSLFANDPINQISFGAAVALRVPLDFAVRGAKVQQLRAKAEELHWQKAEAMTGIIFEVAKANAELEEARKREEVLDRGERVSRRWMTSMIQKMELGLAEVKEISDALQGYFGMRLRHLQSIHDFNVAAAALSRAVGAPIQEKLPTEENW